MKYSMFVVMLFMFIACNQPGSDTQHLQSEIDSLKKQIAETYKPGFGEFMSGIQTHHAKLWFAGQNQNWELAGFEIDEIKEALEDIPKYCSDRPEIKSIGMINPPIDSITNAIEQKNLSMFKNDFALLTNTCNTCHKETDHGFNVVTIPTSLPVVNQDFKPHN